MIATQIKKDVYMLKPAIYKHTEKYGRKLYWVIRYLYLETTSSGIKIYTCNKDGEYHIGRGLYYIEKDIISHKKILKKLGYNYEEHVQKQKKWSNLPAIRDCDKCNKYCRRSANDFV